MSIDRARLSRIYPLRGLTLIAPYKLIFKLLLRLPTLERINREASLLA
jgi:hypothetical protein